ncbi:hypothetical protein RHSIM_Rhsim07G0226300 [Rhododendron simsii]|uniref:Uncharacterized protein n=1 Tax=Rhododendron simsii TaxID=118357 RepID=A0A834GQZ6_RHOSS|nr:hypothetical protein RHSIM_Rhsim07G0226300 [Rhododendron simsii]
MVPPLPSEYFGNSMQIVSAKAAAGELLEHRFGRAAWRVHEAVAGHSDAEVREWVGKWTEDPFICNMGQNEFGMGKAVAIRCGYANKFDGKVTSYPG